MKPKALEGGNAKLAYALMRDLGFTKPANEGRLLEPEDLKQQQEVRERTLHANFKAKLNQLTAQERKAESSWNQ